MPIYKSYINGNMFTQQPTQQYLYKIYLNKSLQGDNNPKDPSMGEYKINCVSTQWNTSWS